MAVLFPRPPVGQTYRPDQADQLLQGFLHVSEVENKQDGKLTAADLDSYSQKQFFVIDAGADVAGYLKTNFGAIAALDGDATSISANDLVARRPELPEVPPPTQPPYQYPQNPAMQRNFAQMMMSMVMMMMMSMMMGIFGRGGGVPAQQPVSPFLLLNQ
ncbi:MAG: hypothetical protein AB7P76_05075 [Candidatus Melainabacteria bacterium]